VGFAVEGEVTHVNDLLEMVTHTQGVEHPLGVRPVSVGEDCLAQGDAGQHSLQVRVRLDVTLQW